MFAIGWSGYFPTNNAVGCGGSSEFFQRFVELLVLYERWARHLVLIVVSTYTVVDFGKHDDVCVLKLTFFPRLGLNKESSWYSYLLPNSPHVQNGGDDVQKKNTQVGSELEDAHLFIERSSQATLKDYLLKRWISPALKINWRYSLSLPSHSQVGTNESRRCPGPVLAVQLAMDVLDGPGFSLCQVSPVIRIGEYYVSRI